VPKCVASNVVVGRQKYVTVLITRPQVFPQSQAVEALVAQAHYNLQVGVGVKVWV